MPGLGWPICNPINITILFAIVVLPFLLHYYYLPPIHIDNSVKPLKKHIEVTIPDNQLIDLKNFTFLINTRKLLCERCDDNFLIVITIPSPTVNVEERDSIRRSWGKSTKCTTVVFLIGNSNRSSINNHAVFENNLYGDIVQGNFEDSRYSSYKNLMGLKWASKHCKKAKFVVKIEEEFLLFLLINNVVIDLVKLRLFLKRVMLEVGGIACKVLKNDLVDEILRNTTIRMHSKDIVPHCWGGFVIYSSEVAHHLLAESTKMPYSYPDEVYITGFLARVLGVKFLNIEPHFFMKPKEVWFMSHSKDLFYN